jgi:hydrogenase expression/formation protein HypC
MTCSDEAVAVHVLELLDNGMARVDGDLRNEEVSLELIEASVGDVVLVHAKVAIAKLLRSP